MWWLTVGCERPERPTRSHAHTSSPPAEATTESIRSLIGSARAANDRASSSASASSEGVGAHGGAAGDGVEGGGRARAMLQPYRRTSKKSIDESVDSVGILIASTYVNVLAPPKEYVMSRVQLALNVADLDESIEFYTRLFQTGPAKVRENYANFSIADPPLKLVLFAAAGDPARSTTSGWRWTRPPRSPRRSPGPRPTGSSRRCRRTCRAASPCRTRRGCMVPTTTWEFYTVLDDAPTMGC